MSRAVVIGGSIAGMCSARVLCDHYDEVVLLDRDRYPSRPGPRGGVPQSRHAHALLARGQRDLEAMFPGFVEQMRAAGALMFDPGVGLAMRWIPGWQELGPNGFDALWSSRELLEFTVRALLRAQTRVELREGAQVTGLLGSCDPSTVTGVRVRADGGGEHELTADLVVDASGRNSHAEEWLRALGIPALETQRVDSRAAYASRLYKAPSQARRPKECWWQGLWVEWEPPTLPRGGVIFPIEGDRWIATLVGIAPDYPPTDEQGFAGFCTRLSSHSLARALVTAEPISAISGYRSLANVYRRYDRLPTPPRGFVAVGDAVCCFNPLYGQGMSSASACSTILGDVLRKRGTGPDLPRAFFRAQSKFIADVWTLATGADFAWPTTEGERPRIPQWLNQYLDLAIQSAHVDAELRRHIAPLFNLVGPLALFFDPRFAGKVLWRAARRRRHVRNHGAPQIPDAPPAPHLTGAQEALGSACDVRANSTALE
jgi:2-polyprenyl-6-methoxyphenol hydroxylase-like FAD-dependent oxidoreductase